MPTLLRIDLRFSGSFAEQPDGDIVGLTADAAGLTLDLNEDLVEDDLSDNLQALGIGADQRAWIASDAAVFRPPTGFDAEASAAMGWPMFRQGASCTRFLRIDAPASEALTTAVHDAFAIASVTLGWADLTAYDDAPTVAVNVIAALGDAVDPRSPRARRADALAAAIQSAVHGGPGHDEP